MNTLKLLKRDQRSRKGLARFDLKKRMHYFILKIYGYEIYKLKPRARLLHLDEYWEAARSFDITALSVHKWLHLNNYKKSAHKGSVPFLCRSTGRPRGLVSKFYISRTLFKKLANDGMLSGVRRAAW